MRKTGYETLPFFLVQYTLLIFFFFYLSGQTEITAQRKESSSNIYTFVLTVIVNKIEKNICMPIPAVAF